MRSFETWKTDLTNRLTQLNAPKFLQLKLENLTANTTMLVQFLLDLHIWARSAGIQLGEMLPTTDELRLWLG
ncbi:MAG: hypothetical protein QW318_06755 [Candidatus Caldarchaeum sp.]